ncbi:MAG: acetate kinase [Spiroplasma sp.]|nr:acetate kinase [Spiroplasma sp.]
MVTKEQINDKILVINAGSSSIKFQLFKLINQKPEFQILAKGLVERIAILGSKIITEVIKGNNTIKHEKIIPIKDHDVGAKLVIDQLKTFKVLKDFNEIIGIGHRLVHGGQKFITSTIITDQVEAAVIDNIALAPLHNPPALKGYHAFKVLSKNIKHVAVFDTSFHNTLPPEKFLYSVPYNWYQNHQIRRYGFHGISYRYILEKLTEVLKKPQGDINAIVCHLGNGASICAIKNGQSFNTSMGLTPLDGLIMGTRSGIIDPSIPNYLCQITKNTQQPETVASVTDALNKASGLLGISEVSSDIRDVVAAQTDQKHPKQNQANLAIKMFCQRVANYIVQYVNDLENKVAALVFTAGIGENGSEIRAAIINEIKILSLKINQKKNLESYSDYLLISESHSAIPIYKIRTNEEIIICYDTFSLIK